jgi:hypothetical protein
MTIPEHTGWEDNTPRPAIMKSDGCPAVILRGVGPRETPQSSTAVARVWGIPTGNSTPCIVHISMYIEILHHFQPVDGSLSIFQ